MRNIAIVTLVMVAGMLSAAKANYVQEISVYNYSVGGTLSWQHTYDNSINPVTSATLTIVADDVDGPGMDMDGEQDEVWINNGVDWQYLGLLNNMGYYTDFNYHPGQGNPNQPLTTTVFNINPSWLNSTLPVQVRIESFWGAEIETSTLTVTPEPTTLALLGLGVLTLLRKRSGK